MVRCACGVLGTALLLLIAAPVATAQLPAPVGVDGVSEAQQYADTIPGFSGEEQVDLTAAPEALPPVTAAQLGALGPAGDEVKRFARATSPFAGLAGGVVEVEDGVGWLLPVILALILLAGLLYIVIQRPSQNPG